MQLSKQTVYLMGANLFSMTDGADPATARPAARKRGATDIVDRAWPAHGDREAMREMVRGAVAAVEARARARQERRSAGLRDTWASPAPRSGRLAGFRRATRAGRVITDGSAGDRQALLAGGLGGAIVAVAMLALLLAGSPFGPGRAVDGPGSALGQGERRELEALLAALDFPTGPIDGVIDPRTREGLRGFRRALGGTGGDARATRRLLEEVRATAARFGG